MWWVQTHRPQANKQMSKSVAIPESCHSWVSMWPSQLNYQWLHASSIYHDILDICDIRYHSWIVTAIIVPTPSEPLYTVFIEQPWIYLAVVNPVQQIIHGIGKCRLHSLLDKSSQSGSFSESSSYWDPWSLNQVHHSASLLISSVDRCTSGRAEWNEHRHRFSSHHCYSILLAVSREQIVPPNCPRKFGISWDRGWATCEVIGRRSKEDWRYRVCATL